MSFKCNFDRLIAVRRQKLEESQHNRQFLTQLECNRLAFCGSLNSGPKPVRFATVCSPKTCLHCPKNVRNTPKIINQFIKIVCIRGTSNFWDQTPLAPHRVPSTCCFRRPPLISMNMLSPTTSLWCTHRPLMAKVNVTATLWLPCLGFLRNFHVQCQAFE